MKKTGSILLTVILGAVMAFGVIAAKPDEDGPKKAWVCHFEDHDGGGVFFTTADGVDLDGDYVLNYVEDGPTQNQIDFCAGFGGEVITISVNALDGHGAQLQERVAGYPDGFKG